MLLDSFSKKQLDSIRNSNNKINIWEGAVRSGKTYSSLWRFIEECRSGPSGQFAIICRTYDTFKRNLLPDIYSIIGSQATYFLGKRELAIGNRIIHVIGADDERAETKIRGPTFASIYMDEITILPETVFKMAISRASITGSKIFGTTNPDSPNHWLKTEFLNGKNQDVTSFKFTMDDNPNLSSDYREMLKRQYQGMWYKRYIEGLWVQAQGAVFDFFDPEIHVVKKYPTVAKEYIVGVDYGTHNPCAFVLLGCDKSAYPNIWVEKEYYWDSNVQQRQKTDSEYAEDLTSFIAGYNVVAIYVDPSAASFKLELSRSNLSVVDAKNDVLNGIRYLSTALSSGTLKIANTCVNLIKEMQSYMWDAKAAQRGEDKPVKDEDHCFIAGTKIFTNSGPKNIEEVDIYDLVLTRGGFKKIKHIFKNTSECSEFTIFGKSITCTPCHEFYTLNRGWVKIKDLIESDILITNIIGLPWQTLSFLTKSNTDATKSLRTTVTQSIIELEKPTALRDLDIFIETFGNTSMEKYHQDTIFITKTEMSTTMTLTILNVFQLLSIYPSMEKILQRIKREKEKKTWIKLGPSLKNGTVLRKEENGTEIMLKDPFPGHEGSNIQKNADIVEENLQETRDANVFVAIHVKAHGEELFTLMMSIKNVFFAEKHLQQINTQKPITAHHLAEEKPIGEKEVYNIHVDEIHEYFANDLLVSNCLDALRYATFSHNYYNQGDSMNAADVRDMERRYKQKPF